MKPKPNHTLPPNVYCRQIKGRTYYFHAKMTNGKRVETSLGSDLDAALDKLDGGKVPESVAAVRKHTDAAWQDELRALFYRTKKRAATRGIEFSLSLDDVVRMCEETSRRCSISGIDYILTKEVGKRFRPWSPSIDRINPDGPYSPENTRMVCAYINIAINQFGLETLEFIAARIARNAKKAPGLMKLSPS